MIFSSIFSKHLYLDEFLLAEISVAFAIWTKLGYTNFNAFKCLFVFQGSFSEGVERLESIYTCLLLILLRNYESGWNCWNDLLWETTR